MARQSICNPLRILKENGRRFKRLWRDERGFWSLPLGLFFLILSIPFLLFRMDVSTARFVRSATYTACDAASLAGAQQYDQIAIHYNSYGEADLWKYTINQSQATVHAQETLLKNMEALKDKNIQLVDYNITFPDDEHVDVEATVTFELRYLERAVNLFLDQNHQYKPTMKVHATATVIQPVGS